MTDWNFSAPVDESNSGDLLPNGLLVNCVLNVRGSKVAGTGTKYWDLELTIDEGQKFARRKVWTNLMDPFDPNNSDGAKKMGYLSIKRILEALGAHPDKPESYNLPSMEALSGQTVPVKIGIEKGTQGYSDKNKVAEFLSPHSTSASVVKDYEKLKAGDNGVENSGQQGSQSGASGQAQTPPQQKSGTPDWLHG